MAAKAAVATSVSAASAPPVTTASASPLAIIRWAWPIACAPAAQADITPNDPPRIPRRIATAAAAALPISIGTASGETAFAPRSRSTSCCCSSEPSPPIPVPITQPTRSDAYGSSSAQPAASTASSAAAIASWVNRSARRASLRERKSVASKSEQRPKPSLIPHSPAAQRSISVVAPTPRGVTAPTPVMTIRRVTMLATPPDRSRRRPSSRP